MIEDSPEEEEGISSGRSGKERKPVGIPTDNIEVSLFVDKEMSDSTGNTFWLLIDYHLLSIQFPLAPARP